MLGLPIGRVFSTERESPRQVNHRSLFRPPWSIFDHIVVTFTLGRYLGQDKEALIIMYLEGSFQFSYTEVLHKGQ